MRKEYRLATLSSWLTKYRSAHVSSGADSLRVVVALSQTPETSISNLPENPRTRREALELLRATGLGGDILSSTSLRPRRIVAGINTVTVEIPAAQLEQLAASPGVEYVRPVRLHRMHLDTSVNMMGVNASIQSRYTGRGIRVAVIDSGIDANHPDLAGRVDLERSRNFTLEGDAKDITDRNGHGTHVAGIIGGAGEEFRGVAPDVEFIACKVFDATGQATEEGAIIEAVRWAVAQGADVINYSGGFAPVFQGTALLPPPWVWPEVLLEEEQEFQRAIETGVVAIVSAGNEGGLGDYGTISLPATCPDVLSVAALSKDGRRSGFSSAGPALRSAGVPVFEMVASLVPDLEPIQKVAKVNLIAPGGEVDAAAEAAGGCYYVGGIVSARSSALGAPNPCVVKTIYEKMSGTSQAAPHITGMAALVLEAVHQTGISWSLDQKARTVQNILCEGCQPLPGLSAELQGSGLPVWERIEMLLKQLLT